MRKLPLLIVTLLAGVVLFSGCGDNVNSSRQEWAGQTLDKLTTDDSGVYLKPESNEPFSGAVGGLMPGTEDEFVEAELVNGKYHGPVKIYFTDGSGKEFLRVEREYDNGVPVGVLKKYNPDGSPNLEQHFADDGSIRCMKNFRNGQVVNNTCDG